MPFTISAFNHDEWERHGLAKFSDYAERITECNLGDGSFGPFGKWFFVPDEPLPSGNRVIYFGRWGNDDSPGASSYSHAEIFDVVNPEDAKAFENRVRHWESQPEYAGGDTLPKKRLEDSDEAEESLGDDDDIPF